MGIRLPAAQALFAEIAISVGFIVQRISKNKLLSAFFCRYYVRLHDFFSEDRVYEEIAIKFIQVVRFAADAGT
jgi:hypothetical protein